jgi:hypothetical protein
MLKPKKLKKVVQPRQQWEGITEISIIISLLHFQPVPCLMEILREPSPVNIENILHVEEGIIQRTFSAICSLTCFIQSLLLSLSWSIDIHKSVGTSFLASKYVFA